MHVHACPMPLAHVYAQCEPRPKNAVHNPPTHTHTSTHAHAHTYLPCAAKGQVRQAQLAQALQPLDAQQQRRPGVCTAGGGTYEVGGRERSLRALRAEAM